MSWLIIKILFLKVGESEAENMKNVDNSEILPVPIIGISVPLGT